MKGKKALSLAVSAAMTMTVMSGFTAASAAEENLRAYNFTAEARDGYISADAGGYSSEKGYGFVSETLSMPSRTLNAVPQKTNGGVIAEQTSAINAEDNGGLAFRIDMDSAGAYKVKVETTGTKETTVVSVNGMEGGRLTGTSAWDDAGLVSRKTSAKWSGATWEYELVSYDGSIVVEAEPKTVPGSVGIRSITVTAADLNTEPGSIPTAYLLGDSTVKTYTFEEAPMCGWGQVIDRMFDESKVSFVNYSQGGRSMRSNYTEGRFNDILLTGKPGDYVFIHSAHNDASDDADERFGSGTTEELYKKWLNDVYIPSIKLMGMIPVLVTTMPRIDGGGAVKAACSFDTVSIMKQAAESDSSTEIIDLAEGAESYVTALGGSAARAVYMPLEAGESPGGSKSVSFANGGGDSTHFKEAAAVQFAYIMAEDIYKQGKSGSASGNMSYLANSLNAGVKSACENGASSAPGAPEGYTAGEYTNQVRKLIQLGILDPEFDADSSITVGEYAEAVEKLWDLPSDALADYKSESTQAPSDGAVEYDGTKLTIPAAAGYSNAAVVYAAYNSDNTLKSVLVEENCALPYEKNIELASGTKVMVFENMTSLKPLFKTYTVSTIKLAEAGEVSSWLAKAADGTQIGDIPDDGSADCATVAAGTNLMAGTGCELSPMIDMTYKSVSFSGTDKDGVAVASPEGLTGRLTGKGTPDGFGATGSSMKFVPDEDGVVDAYVKVNAGKVFTVNKYDGTEQTTWANEGAASAQKMISAPVKAGQTYYIYSQGGGTDFFGIVFRRGAEYEQPVVTEEPETDVYKWNVSASDLTRVAGDELMTGLTMLFDNTSTNSKYISSSENGKITDGVATGSALKFVAPANGNLSVTMIDLGTATKSVTPVIYDAEARADIFSYTTTEEKETVELKAYVTEGKTYYITATGTKGRFSAASFEKSEIPDFDEPEFVEKTPVSSEIILTREVMGAILYDAYTAKFGSIDQKAEPYMSYEGYAPAKEWAEMTDRADFDTALYGKSKAAYEAGIFRPESGISRGSAVIGTEMEPKTEVTLEKAAKSLYFIYVLGFTGDNALLPNDEAYGDMPEVTQPPAETGDPSQPEDMIFRADDSAVSSLQTGTYTDAKGNDITGAITPSQQLGKWTVNEGWQIKSASGAEYTHTDGTEYSFTKSLRGGSGNTEALSVSFVPEGSCKVTAVFDGTGAAGRVMNIAQNGKVIASAQSETGKVSSVTAEITEADIPVYVYGGGSNKNLYAVIVEYMEPETQADYAKEWDFSKLTTSELCAGAGLTLNGAQPDGSTMLVCGVDGSVLIPMDTDALDNNKFGIVRVSYAAGSDLTTESGRRYNEPEGGTAEYVYSAAEAEQQGYVKLSGAANITSIERTTLFKAPVSGSALYSGTTELTGKNILFTDKSTGNRITASYGGSYSAELVNGHSYTISIENEPNISATLETVNFTANVKKTEHNIEFIDVALTETAGELVGLDDYTGITLKFTDINDDSSVTTAELSNIEGDTDNVNKVTGSLSVMLMPNTEYQITADGLPEGYSLSPLSQSYTMQAGDTAPFKNILFEKETPVIDYSSLSDGCMYVGPSSEYKTIGEALAVVEKMTGRNGDRVTLILESGAEFIEQVIVKSDNVTMKSEDPENRAKIRWYYGTGYTYYSAKNGYYDRDRAVQKTERGGILEWGAALNVRGAEFNAENIDFEATLNIEVLPQEIADGAKPAEPGSAEYSDGREFKPERTLELDAKSQAATERAAAVKINGDHAEFLNCSMRSSQDTLGTGNKTAYFKGCEIYGNTDYICGGNNCLFDECDLIWEGYSDNAKGGYITACKTSSTADMGYVFRNCIVRNNTDDTDMKFSDSVNGSWGRNWGGEKCGTYFIDTVIDSSTPVPGAWVKMGGELSLSKLFVKGITKNGETVDDSAFNPNGLLADGDIPQAEDVLGSWVPDYIDI